MKHLLSGRVATTVRRHRATEPDRRTACSRRAGLRPLVLALACLAAYAAGAEADTAQGGVPTHGVPLELLWIPLVLLVARLGGLVERFGQPAVLGELVVGVVLGNLILLGLPFFEPMTEDAILIFLAELGVIILLFQIGLESSLAQLRSVGGRALGVALIGVVVPFALGAYIVGPLLLPGQSSHAYLFMGAALTATSVGITARVFRDLGRLHLPEAQIVLGAAIIDDVLGLVILAVVSALVTAGSVSVGVVTWIMAKATLFLAAALVLGRLLAPSIGRVFSRLQSGVGMKLTLAISIALLMAYFAGVVGLAPIVGAFAAGLVLEPVDFRGFREPAVVEEVRASVRDAEPVTRQKVLYIIDRHSHRHVEELIEPIGHFLIPIFFVLTGMAVDLQTLFDLPILLVALGLTLAAFFGKVVSGIAAGPVHKSLVGWGMVPRGEVGLIFATIGRSLGVLNQEVFSVIVLVVIFTTLLTPPVLQHLLKSTRALPEPSPQPGDQREAEAAAV
jgi:Kef-type K+ transport system membrane component KefB